ncbi:MAG: antitoxin [Thermodesulfobacteriota bacterium]
MAPKTARLFMNGRSQAVRLPKAFRFEGDEVWIHREDDRVILTPKPRFGHHPGGTAIRCGKIIIPEPESASPG